MTAIRTDRDGFFENQDRDGDGARAIETRCADHRSEAYVWRESCRQLFRCEACFKRFSSSHKVNLGGMPYCPECAVEAVENQEPECECRQTDVDSFDAVGCEFHAPASSWNVRRRVVTAAEQQICTKTKENVWIGLTVRNMPGQRL